MEDWQLLGTEILAALTEIIGSYQIPINNGMTLRDAIAYIPPAVAKDRKVQGLEVIISRLPRVERSLILNRREHRTKIYSVFLIQHDLQLTTEAAVDLLLNFYPLARAIELPESDFAARQTKIDIPIVRIIKLRG